MKEKYIIEIESTSPSEFGVNFMQSVIQSMVQMMNGYKKCYHAKMTLVERNGKDV